MRTALGEVRGGWGGWGRLVRLATGLLVAVGCSRAPSTTSQTSKTSTNLNQPVFYDPAHDLGSLCQAVQLSGIFPDSKTFVDARPLFPPGVIAARYDSARHAPGFDLQAFVARQFELPRPVGEGVALGAARARTIEDHIRALWPSLTRQPDSADAQASLIPLPHPYVVPGGRIREVYYWTSYFSMLSL